MIFLYVPLMYTFHTRLLGLKSRIAWMFTYVVPAFIAYIYIYNADFNNILTEMMSFGVSAVCIYGAYELGYMYNDAELTKREVNPTLRLRNIELVYYERYKLYIYMLRLFFLFGTLYILHFISVSAFYSTSFSCLLIIILYVLYNSTRSVINIPLYSCLVFFRYFGSVFLFCGASHVFLLWIIYPLVSTIEFAAKDKYKISMLSGLEKNDRSRFFIYFVLVAILVLLYVSYGDVIILPLMLASYFLSLSHTYFLEGSSFKKLTFHP